MTHNSIVFIFNFKGIIIHLQSMFNDMQISLIRSGIHYIKHLQYNTVSILVHVPGLNSWHIVSLYSNLCIIL